MSPRRLISSVALCVVITPVALGEDVEIAALEAGSPIPESRLEEVLKKWAAAFGDVRTSRAAFSRYEYDSLFLLEKRGHGEIRFQAPDRLLWTCEPVEFDEATTSDKLSIWGETYRLLAADAVTWYLDERTVLIVNPGQKTYNVWEVPLGMRDDSRTPIDPLRADSPESAYLQEPAPLTDFFAKLGVRWGLYDLLLRMGSFLSGGDIDALQEEFDWKIDRDTNAEVRLSGRPRTTECARVLSRVDVILDPMTYRHKAVRFIDSGGTKETVYVLSDLAINESSGSVRPPRLNGYKALNFATTLEDDPAASDSSNNSWVPVICGLVFAILILQ